MGVIPISEFLFVLLQRKTNSKRNSKTSDNNDIKHNSRTSIDMKLGPVTKLDKKNTATLKKLTMTYVSK